VRRHDLEKDMIGTDVGIDVRRQRRGAAMHVVDYAESERPRSSARSPGADLGPS
jgi:hypothetical protein